MWLLCCVCVWAFGCGPSSDELEQERRLAAGALRLQEAAEARLSRANADLSVCRSELEATRVRQDAQTFEARIVRGGVETLIAPHELADLRDRSTWAPALPPWECALLTDREDPMVWCRCRGVDDARMSLTLMDCRHPPSTVLSAGGQTALVTLRCTQEE